MAVMPAAQAIVRNSPPGRLREWAWRWGKWRSYDFTTKANGVVFSGNTLDLIQGYLYWFGVWEPNLTHFIARRMNEAPDRTFVDVGANIGYYSMLVASRHPQSRVIAIEAFPPIVEKLRKNIEQNALKNIRLISEAASDHAGVLEFYYAGHLNEGGTTSIPGKFRSAAVAVPCKPLSELLTDDEISVMRLMKIDVEGAERSVIAGLLPKMSMLPKDLEIVTEISGKSIESSKFIFDTFVEKGFHAYEIDNDYSPNSYLYPESTKKPRRLTSIPSRHTDVIFSSIDTEFL